jgi:UDP-2,3-diacylglucosamine hydrolase
VVGNHDNLLDFLKALESYIADEPHVSCHPHYVRLGKALFLHGDVANRKMNHLQLSRWRERWHDDTKKARFLDWIYDVAFALRVHKAVHRITFPSALVAKRVMHYLESIGEGPESGTEDVYFGHTHMALSDYEHGGVRFHNCGAPMPGLEFNILKIEID